MILLKSDPAASRTAAIFLSVWAFHRSSVYALRKLIAIRLYGLAFYSSIHQLPRIFIKSDIPRYKDQSVCFDSLGEYWHRGRGVGGANFYNGAHVENAEFFGKHEACLEILSCI
jgi:hypothetical protein